MAVGRNDPWTVVGVGMGGKGLLAELGIAGYRLRAFRQERRTGCRHSRSEGTSRRRSRQEFCAGRARDDRSEGRTQGAKVILVSTNGDDHPQVARDLAPYLVDGQIIVLIQGHFGGTLVFRKALDEAGCRANVQLAEMDGYPYMMTVRSPDRVEMTTYKECISSSHCQRRAQKPWSTRSVAFPGLVAGPNLMQTGLTDLGSVFHACGIVTNVGIAEAGKPYNFYAHNMTPSVCNLIEAVDRERVAVAAAYGIETPDVFKWLETTYKRKEISLHWSMQANAVTHYRYSPAPNSLGHRFLVTDIGSGLVAWSSLGKVAGVPTPTIDAVVQIAGALTKRNFFEEGRNLRNLGLEGKTIEQIMAFVAS